MTAGASARHEAQRCLFEAEEYERRARTARAAAHRFGLAARTEARVWARVEALTTLGWTAVPDRRWPGTRNANIDLLLVGPGGLAVVDVKAWRSVRMVEDSVFCDGECRDDEVDKVSRQTHAVAESLDGLGLAPTVTVSVLVLAGRSGIHESVRGVSVLGEWDLAAWLTRRGARLDADQQQAVLVALDEACPPALDERSRPRPRPRPRRARPVLPRSASPAPMLFDVSELHEALVEAAATGPIEEWMSFLHPDQLRVVRTSWSGPARIRGPAGTGKTVVGLHRAAYLAERGTGRLLFVSFVRTLPVVLAALYHRMAPQTSDRVDFTGLHRFALGVLDRRGIRSRLNGGRAANAYEASWAHVGSRSPLARLEAGKRYWREEIDHVIKGRGLTSFAAYASLPRAGRRTPLRPEHREAMWDLYRDYQARLDTDDVDDFNDVLLAARDELLREPLDPPYASVIVDEVQDLSLVGVQLLHQVAGDRPDSFLLIGDGQQSVYPGGFTLAEAGISVAGRAAVLDTNYRNAAAVLDRARTVVAGDVFHDLDHRAEPARRTAKAVRPGGRVGRVDATNTRDLYAALHRGIEQLRTGGVRLGDMAVLAARTATVTRCRRVLTAAGIAAQDLIDYAGTTTQAVKVGTFKRAKGLEFAYVFLPELVDGPVPRDVHEPDDVYRERAERERRELYVGMTRARDGLWLGYVRDGA